MAQRQPRAVLLQKWQEALWLLIGLVTPLFLNLWVEQQFEASKVWLFRTLVWLLAILWVSGWINGNPYKSLPLPIRHLIIALSLVLLLSTFVSDNQTIAIFGSLDRAGGILTQFSYLLLFCCVATQIDMQGSRQLLYLLILTGIPICLLGLGQAVGWQPLPVFTDARSSITTTLGRANFTGAYLALLLPLTLAGIHATTNRWQRIGYGALIGLELIIIALTQARAAWVATFVGISLFYSFQYAPRWSWRMRAGTFLGGLIILGSVLLLILRRGIINGGSIAARWTIWQASLRLIWSHLWLGYGADTLELHFPSVYPPQLVYYQGRGVVVDRAHNWLLDWTLNYGIVATFIFGAIVYFILRQGWQRLNTKSKNDVVPAISQPPESHWLSASMASICAHLAGNLFLFDVVSTATLFWLLLAVVTAVTIPKNRQTLPKRIPAFLRHSIILITMLLGSWLIWQSNIKPLLADNHSWRGTQAFNRGDTTKALAEYMEAVRWQPRRAPYHVAVALTAAKNNAFEQAETAIESAITLRPNDPVLYTHLAGIYAIEALENPEKVEMAYDAYEQAITLAPTISLIARQYADLAIRSGDIELANYQAQRAVELDATDGIAYGILGWAQLQNGNLLAAQNAFEQAVKWEPDSADFYLGLATTHFQQGNISSARQAINQSLTLDPTYTPALTLQLQLEE